MKDFSKVKCIVLDWDGTLITAEPLIHETYTETLLQLKIKFGFENLPWAKGDTHRQNGRSPADIFTDQKIWGNYETQAKEIFYQELSWLREAFPDLIKLKPDAEELLKKLNELPKKPRIVLLANKTHDILMAEVIKYNLLEMFDTIIGSQHDAAIDKPSKAAFERAVEGLEITDPHQEVIYIGDNPTIDPRFAAAYGAASILINDCQGSTAADISTLIKMWWE